MDSYTFYELPSCILLQFHNCSLHNGDTGEIIQLLLFRDFLSAIYHNMLLEKGYHNAWQSQSVHQNFAEQLFIIASLEQLKVSLPSTKCFCKLLQILVHETEQSFPSLKKISINKERQSLFYPSKIHSGIF